MNEFEIKDKRKEISSLDEICELIVNAAVSQVILNKNLDKLTIKISTDGLDMQEAELKIYIHLAAKGFTNIDFRQDIRKKLLTVRCVWS